MSDDNHSDIVDLDQIGDNGVTKSEEPHPKIAASAEKPTRGRKKGTTVKKSGPRQKGDDFSGSLGLSGS